MMHSLFRHLHGGDDHAPAESAPQTSGNVIHWARRYDWVVQVMALGQAGRLRRRTIDFAQIAPGERVLDVGCGTGDLTLMAQAHSEPGGQVTGIDPSPEMLEVARGKARREHAAADFRVGVIEQLPFPADSFDVVLSSLMLHHLPADLKPKALAEIRRVLKPTGRFVIIDFKNLLEAQQVIALLKEAGFTPVEVQSMWLKKIGMIRAA